MTVTVERIPSTDPRLARHVRHDDRSWDFRLDTSGLQVASVKWERKVPVFDQGRLGSCTGNAGVGCMGTAPFFGTVANPHYSEDETGAVKLYSDATRVANPNDPSQQYLPNDVGCDGLSIAKALRQAGEIAGYQHTFTLEDALKALQLGPTIVGIPWLNSMFTSGPDGILTVDFTSSVAGGHEPICDEYDDHRGLVGFTNSWTAAWGLHGRFYVHVADFARLLAQRGDVILFTPVHMPAPPLPVSPDAALTAVAEVWVERSHYGDNARMAAALRTWLARPAATVSHS